MRLSKKKHPGIIYPVLISLLILTGSSFAITPVYAANNRDQKENFRPEHIMFNVPDPLAMIKWYCDNLGMVVIRKGTAPTYSSFIADSGKHMMLELGNFADYPKMDFAKIDLNSMHLAFVVNNIKQIKEKLVAAGATVAQDLFKTPGGDQVMVLRDPWGLAIQFVERVDPMFKYTGLRMEHLEFNVPDTHKKAKWFEENLGMKIMREGGAPTFNMFISDPEHNMMMELNQNKDFPMLDFWKVSHMATHFAFTVKDIQAAKKKLIAGGAQLVEDITKTPGGDYVMMMRDPWGEPIQIVHRAEPMLK